jgi:hypothetical protein
VSVLRRSSNNLTSANGLATIVVQRSNQPARIIDSRWFDHDSSGRTTRPGTPAMGDGGPSVRVERAHSAATQFAGDLKDNERAT